MTTISLKPIDTTDVNLPHTIFNVLEGDIWIARVVFREEGVIDIVRGGLSWLQLAIVSDMRQRIEAQAVEAEAEVAVFDGPFQSDLGGGNDPAGG